MPNYTRKTYLMISRDPVHIGTGGYRLGRVDNSIAREPGTNLPKIPGTSLHGAARAYAARLYKNPAAAGQDHSGVTNPSHDPVCYTFGYISRNAANADEPIAYSGVANIFDAHILLFPVASMQGPLWVTTQARLAEVGVTTDAPATDQQLLATGDLGERVNLGWLMLTIERQTTLEWPTEWNEAIAPIEERIVIAPEKLFGQIVNSNLEVRTSVSIDPETGAAKDGALFTYEALPRTTWLTMDVVIDDYRNSFPVVSETMDGEELLDWQSAEQVTEAGLRLIEWLGVGGMGTRGFGRIGIVGQPLSDPFSQGGA